MPLPIIKVQRIWTCNKFVVFNQIQKAILIEWLFHIVYWLFLKD